MDKKTFVIAIDGPVASGKGTIAAMLAQELGGYYLSSGALYRALALFCLENNISIEDEVKVTTALSDIEIVFEKNRMFLNQVDVTQKITTQEVANGSSIIAIFPKVRQQLVLKQQQIAKKMIDEGKIVVAEGRDTGTRVFPNSPLKIFLTASKEVRVARRFAQYRDLGEEVAEEEILEQIAERDRRDTERVADPLPKHPESLGYFVLDSSTLTEDQTLAAVQEELKKRGLINK
jgi:cytidylate kinase